MKKAIPSLMLWSGFLGLFVAACLGLFLWRIIWIGNHPLPEEGSMMDWSPYPEYLAAALNWWVPFSVLICGVSVFLTRHSKRRRALIVGWWSHAISATGLVSLGLWFSRLLRSEKQVEFGGCIGRGDRTGRSGEREASDWLETECSIEGFPKLGRRASPRQSAAKFISQANPSTQIICLESNPLYCQSTGLSISRNLTGLSILKQRSCFVAVENRGCILVTNSQGVVGLKMLLHQWKSLCAKFLLG
jgi:hypothetical protein